MTEKRLYLEFVVLTFVALLLVASIVINSSTRTTGARTEQTIIGGRKTRIEFQARTTFLLCSRDAEPTTFPTRRRQAQELCKGYESVAKALATETAKQERADRPR